MDTVCIYQAHISLSFFLTLFFFVDLEDPCLFRHVTPCSFQPLYLLSVEKSISFEDRYHLLLRSSTPNPEHSARKE
jgi:hypothetical protein